MVSTSSQTATHKAQPETVAFFVSDLHLTAAMPHTAAAFFRFLREQAAHARALYLLGDIFEYWAGDDDLTEPFNRSVVDALRDLSTQGVAIYWLAGNRDFLVGEQFAQASGVTLLAEPHITSIAGQHLVLVHGDAQCTDDAAYMAFRRQVRDPAWQQAFLSQPLAQRKAIIAGLREGSRDAQRSKTMEIMDVNPQAINQLFAASAVSLMIHGHTHRPARHVTASGVRHVLPDWDCEGESHRGGWLALDAAGDMKLISLATPDSR
jgi:UDP-2,3-diacylglucosamine hydrolase